MYNFYDKLYSFYGNIKKYTAVTWKKKYALYIQSYSYIYPTQYSESMPNSLRKISSEISIFFFVLEILRYDEQKNKFLWFLDFGKKLKVKSA